MVYIFVPPVSYMRECMFLFLWVPVSAGNIFRIMKWKTIIYTPRWNMHSIVYPTQYTCDFVESCYIVFFSIHGVLGYPSGLHWNGNDVIFTKFSSLTTPKLWFWQSLMEPVMTISPKLSLCDFRVLDRQWSTSLSEIMPQQTHSVINT